MRKSERGSRRARGAQLSKGAVPFHKHSFKHLQLGLLDLLSLLLLLLALLRLDLLELGACGRGARERVP